MPAPVRTELSIPELTMTWGRGWTVSRGTPAPVAVPGGYRVDVGQVGHRVRHVLHTYTADSLVRLADRVAAPGCWIKAVGPVERLRSVLPSAWAMDSAGYLMSTRLTPGRVEPPEPYRLVVETEGGFTRARVFDGDGAPAGSAQMGRAGTCGIVDKVETAMAHRRRGLGTVLMRALSDRASELGMTTGILAGTDDGLALYSVLGWQLHSEFSGAFIREDPEALE